MALRGTLLVILWLAMHAMVSAQQAGNQCAQAGLLEQDGFYAFNTTGASGDDPCFPGAPTVWYRFTPPQDGILRALLCGSSFNTYLSIYAGANCATLTCSDRLAENRATCGANAALIIPVEVGESYLLAINGDGMFDQGAGSLEFEFLPGWPDVVAGDDCETAGVITTSGLYPFDTTNASRNDPCHVGPPAVFFTFTAPASGSVVAGTCGAGYRSSRLTVPQSSVCPPSCTDIVAQGSTGCGDNPTLSFGVEQGAAYVIVISGVASNDFGPGVLDFVFTPDAVLGDVNEDGIVNVADVTALANMLRAGTPPVLAVGDVNGDGETNDTDVEELARLLVDP